MSKRTSLVAVFLAGVSACGAEKMQQGTPLGVEPPDATPASVPAPAAGTCKAEPFRSPLRRLTRQEYNNTVRDLLGDTTAPADRFPADEVSGGFSNNAAVLTVSPLLAEKYAEAAETLAANAVKDLDRLVGCDVARTGEEPCARQFIERFGRRAFRRPLAQPEIDRLVRLYSVGRDGATFARGVEVVIRAILQAPHFLYRLESAPNARSGQLVRVSSYELASRLSYLLWATMPDEALFTAAARNELATPTQIAARARAMLDDPRARRAVSAFYEQWLRLPALDSAAKDAAVYPELTPELRAAMRAELPGLIDHHLWGAGDRKVGTLLTAPIGFVSPPLARLYGVPTATGVVQLPAAERAGVLTQAGVMAVLALPTQSSPILRGKFVREAVLCQEMPPQPPDLVVTDPPVVAGSSTRERFAQHTTDAACAICHKLMDPIGFGFEAYDGIGKHRRMDGGRPVDDAGELVSTRDADGPFKGAPALAARLAVSSEVRDCVATQWYRFAFGRLEGPGDSCSVTALRTAFAASGYDLRELLVALVQTEAFLHRPVLPTEVMP